MRFHLSTACNNVLQLNKWNLMACKNINASRLAYMQKSREYSTCIVYTRELLLRGPNHNSLLLTEQAKLVDCMITIYHGPHL